MAASQNDYEASPLLSLESLRIGILLKDAEVVGWSLTYVAVARFFVGDLAEATRLSESALSLARLMQLPRVELATLDLLAYVFLASGDLDRAVDFGGQGLDKSRTCCELWVRTLLLNVMSQASWRRGEHQRAKVLAQEGASCSHALDDPLGLALVIETLAWMAAEQAACERSATLLGAAQHIRQGNILPLPEPYRPQHARSIALTAEGLGQAAFDLAFKRGQAMTADEGVAFAVEAKQPPRPAPEPKIEPPTGLTLGCPAFSGRVIQG